MKFIEKDGKVACIHDNGCLLGKLEKYRGRYYFYPTPSKSDCGWSEESIKPVAEKLTQLNK